MGFFSWLTADTKESIRSIHSGDHDGQVVYLLQPGGKKPIEEPAYEGYGTFGGKDAYVWLAENNMTEEERKGLDEEDLRSRGINMELSTFYEDKDDGSRWSYHAGEGGKYGLKPFEGRPGTGYHGDYGAPQSKYGGKTPNQLRDSGQWIEHKMAEVMLPEGHEYKPLKFSFNPKARYEDLPASENDPTQGYFGTLAEAYEDIFIKAMRKRDINIFNRIGKSTLDILKGNLTPGFIKQFEEMEKEHKKVS